MIPIQHDESYADTPWRVVDTDGTLLSAHSDRDAAATTADRLPGSRVQHYRQITLAKLRAQDHAQQTETRMRYGSKPDQSMSMFLDQLEGLDLDATEWSTVAWFVGWDSNATMASILRKARAAGMAAAVTELSPA